VTVPAGAPVSALAPGEDGLVWHTLRADQILQTTSLDVRQWLICLAVALSIVVMSEIRKAVARRHTAPNDPTTR
jgi:hypothetical protein